MKHPEGNPCPDGYAALAGLIRKISAIGAFGRPGSFELCQTGSFSAEDKALFKNTRPNKKFSRDESGPG
jgi:hypothetical protein